MNVSPRSHIYRLAALLVIAVVGFVAFRSFAIPSSWDFEHFFRADSLEELKLQPLQIGGNESCAGSDCHDQKRIAEKIAEHKEHFQALANGNHKGLACENCHGPLSAHVRDGKHHEAANINRDNTLCLGCHAQLISRPEKFPQFDSESTGHWYFDVEITRLCRDCHDPHEPRQISAKRARLTQTSKPAQEDDQTGSVR